MRHGNLVIAFLCAAVFAVGYPTRSEENIEKMKEGTKETAEAVRDYTFAQKAEFVAKMKSELAHINAKIDKLSVKAEQAGDEAKAEAKSKLQALREQVAKLNKQLDAADNVVEADWADFKSGVNKSCNDMKDAFKRSRQWLSKKIAP